MKTPGKLLLILLALGAAGLVVLFATHSPDASEEGAAAHLWTDVRRGPLVIDIEQAGEIKPSEQITIKSEVEGRVSILYIAPEGTMARKGDLLVELDVASKRDELVNQEIEVENAESDVTLKQEDLEIARNQAASDVEQAEQDLTFAKEDLVKYVEGEYPNKLSEAQGAVTLAEQELEQAKEKYEWSKKLHAENFLSESELKSDELAWKSKALSLQTSRGNLALLETYTYKRERAELESQVRQKTSALERTRRKARSSIIQAESSLLAKTNELSRQRQKLEKIREQIAMARVLAPMDGQVIHSTSSQRPWENNEPLKEGVEVWQHRDLIYLPTADTFIATCTIHESVLKKVSTGMPVRVRCDAIPDKVFEGTLSKIAPMADTSRRWMNADLKEYPAEVSIEGGVGELKSGMSCRVQILVAQYEDAVYAPVQCVVRVGGDPCVWVRNETGEPERRVVKTGLDNNRFIHIVSGLEAGDAVLLTPPLGGSMRDKGSSGPRAAPPSERP